MSKFRKEHVASMFKTKVLMLQVVLNDKIH